MDSDQNHVEQNFACFPVTLRGEGTGLQIGDAAKAVREEYQNGTRWKRLHCRRVSVFSERDRGTVFVIHVGSSFEFDWTWEGAIAFRPKSIDDFGMLSNVALENTVYNDDIVWSGEILEVDEQNGCLFVAVDDPECIPTTGSFFVRPFEFLAVLDAVYNDPRFENEQKLLSVRLAATQGSIHPKLSPKSNIGLPHLNDLWNHSWSVLWGPPGTGKTHTTGEQVASIISEDADERILVVSTTNKATDEVALSIGKAAKKLAREPLDNGELIRVGKGASFRAFANKELITMLQGTESDTLAKIDRLAQQLRLFDNMEEKALARKQISELKTGGSDQGTKNFLDANVRCVVSTAFKAMSMLRNGMVKSLFEKCQAPFTTIIIDEAGLISRVAVAALSLLAAKRVVLVGDSKQLAPISRISRVLPNRQKTWLASSGLSHLDELEQLPDAVHLLSEQRRMHPDVCKVVSDFQYDGLLTTAKERQNETSKLPDSIGNFSRAIWYVLDADAKALATIRAERGPGNKSWIRKGTLNVLQKLLSTTSLQKCDGLFISPYKAQAQMVSKQFGKWKLTSWESSTVHSQQGSEADIVVFDTVNAGSYNWPFEEWKRLINVGLSRAREAVIVLASRSEMDEPYLKPLISVLRQGVIQKTGKGFHWQEVDGPASVDFGKVSELKSRYQSQSKKSNCIGKQFDERREMTPVLSKEQQRLTNLELDGKPRLVRGVAGSGKSVVLCNWLAKTVKRLKPDSKKQVWAVYANRSLHKLLRQSVESAWDYLREDDLFGNQPFPWENVSLLHIKDVLAGILPEESMSMEQFEFDYDRAAEEFLNRHDVDQLLPRCTALFIDEAQDMGPSTLRLLLSLVEQGDSEDPNSRSAHIFYDNAQNIYGRKTPTWSEFGLNMRGRSTIMRESFRSTKPITEFAVNVLEKLSNNKEREDQKELVRLGLIEPTTRDGDDWLSVRYNQVHGPAPIFHSFDDRRDEIKRIGNHIRHLTQEEAVRPTDICMIYNGKRLAEDLQLKLAPTLAKIGIELSLQKNRPFERNENTLVMTTSHSYKGYESDVIIIPGVDQFVTGQGDVLANNLYVAMTRARSLLAIYGTRDNSNPTKRIFDSIDRCLEQLNSTAEVVSEISRLDQFNDLLEQVGDEHRDWLRSLWNRFDIQVEPIMDESGNVIAQPLFWFEYELNQICACCFNLEALKAESIKRIVCFSPGDPVV
ncbi:MAG: AAA domain-containing protein [Planctomycetota bacterium]